MTPPPTQRIAYFVTPHGFGHAARACAVIAALQDRNPELICDIFTTVNKQFFQDSLTGPFVYHELATDVGLVQQTLLDEDLPETARRLDAFYPLDDAQVGALAADVTRPGCAAVISDIAPMGVAVARRASLPGVLIENFTWDWIYAGYAGAEPALDRHGAYLAALFDEADVHIQTPPICRARTCDLTAGVVSRSPRCPAHAVRAALGIEPDRPLVLLTRGDIEGLDAILARLARLKDLFVVIAGVGTEVVRADRVTYIPHASAFYHPDLVHAADVVIGKLGYSTVAEVYHAGVPFVYVTRDRFAESPVLADFVEAHSTACGLTPQAFKSAEWVDALPELAAAPRRQRPEPNGAYDIAEFLLQKCL